MGETAKARSRRQREGWFARYVPLDRPGIDIGCGRDPLNAVFRRYDQAYGDGDAQFMAGVPDNSFTTVYASHVLEHVHDPGIALENWYRILAPGGYLLISVPHRDLYERRKTLPSRWNGDHKTFWLPETHEPPITRGLRQTIGDSLSLAVLVELRIVNEGYIDPGPEHHAHGEFSIEAVLRKPHDPAESDPDFRARLAWWLRGARRLRAFLPGALGNHVPVPAAPHTGAGSKSS
jgi:SAM-dependent methyltransferase